MGALDVALLGLGAAAVISAASRGFARSGTGVLCFWAGILAACWLYIPAGWPLERWLDPSTARLAAFGLVVALACGFGAVAAWYASGWVERQRLGAMDRAAGAAFGVVHGVLLAALAVVFLSALAHPVSERLLAGSRFAPVLTGAALRAEELLPEETVATLRRDAAQARPPRKARAPQPPVREI